jgi:hypothetical protein
MKTPEPVFAEKFAAAALNWNLDKLYDDITDAKQRYGITRRKPITPTEKACLRGLLSGYTPSEIALQLNREPVGLRVDLSRGLYRYIEMLADCPLKDWSKVASVLAAAGYSNPTQAPQNSTPIQPQPSTDPSCVLPQQELAVAPQLPRLEDHETRWVGREPLLYRLIQKLQNHCRILSLVGITGVGKSALAIRLALEPIITQTWPTIRVIRFDAEKNTFEPFAKQILGAQFPQDPTLQTNPKQLIEPLLDSLRSQPCLLILDMVENLLASDHSDSHRFQDPAFTLFFDQLIQAEDIPSRFILTSQDQIPVIAEGRYRGRSHVEHLKGLDPTESLQFFATWEIVPACDRETEYLQHIIQTYEGHPLALQIIVGEILEFPYCSDISAYWQDYGQEIVAGELQKQDRVGTPHREQITLAYYSLSLSDLVKSRIDRTLHRLRATAPLAYILLCMGSVYRCSVERAAWLLLIKDSPKESQTSAFQTLQRRCFLEVDPITGQVSYRLHSLIRSVALQHLTALDSNKSILKSKSED